MLMNILKSALTLPLNIVGGIANGISGVLSGGNAAPAETQSASFSDEFYQATMTEKAAKLLKKYDKNGDGILTLDELKLNAKQFSMIDASQDGKIDLKELTGLMAYLDSNKDTNISAEEKRSFDIVG